MVVTVIGAITGTINLNLSQDNIEILKRVGSGIGSIPKIREVYDNKTDTFYNESYVDELQLLENGCDRSYCYFILSESGGINKEFKVKLGRICSEIGICKEFKEEYECCLTWREETDEEILSKVNKKVEEILNNIVDVTLDRESRSKTERFEEMEVII